jgi:hypothetical protein
MPVANAASVGGLRLLSELALRGAHPLAGREGPRGGALERLFTGAELEQAELLGGQGGLGEGVVLLPAEQAPEEAGELAGAGLGDEVSPSGSREGSRFAIPETNWAPRCFRSRPTPKRERAAFAALSRVAGAGFEPATFGL